MASILNIGERLEAIVDLCDKTTCIADIGCDHGYVAAELILQEKAQKVIATEKSPACLNKAVLLADSINIAYFISFREGAGFSVVTKKDDIKLAIIAGMGGREIINILTNKPKYISNFIFQPQSDVVLLRQFLLANNYKILVDKLVKEGDKFYNIIKVTKGRQKLKPIEIYFGKNNFTDNYQLFFEYLTKKYKDLKRLKDRFGELSIKNEEDWVNTNEAIHLFGVTGEQIVEQEKLKNNSSEQNEQKETANTEKENNENIKEQTEQATVKGNADAEIKGNDVADTLNEQLYLKKEKK